MTDDELKRIVEAVIEALKNNPAFVTRDICEERYKACTQRYEWIVKAVRGLYWFIAGVGIAVIGAITTVILMKL